MIVSTKTSQQYQLLIKFIIGKLKEKNNWKNELKKVNDEESRPIYGLRFSSFGSPAERTNFVDGLVAEINKVDEFLNLVAGRHDERHKELVSLLIEQFEINRELETSDPKAAGGYYHQICVKERLEEIARRITEIITAKE